MCEQLACLPYSVQSRDRGNASAAAPLSVTYFSPLSSRIASSRSRRTGNSSWRSSHWSPWRSRMLFLSGDSARTEPTSHLSYASCSSMKNVLFHRVAQSCRAWKIRTPFTKINVPVKVQANLGARLKFFLMIKHNTVVVWLSSFNKNNEVKMK